MMGELSYQDVEGWNVLFISFHHGCHEFSNAFVETLGFQTGSVVHFKAGKANNASSTHLNRTTPDPIFVYFSILHEI